MEGSSRYSSVSLAYNAHCALLDQARQVFQKDVEQLTESAKKHVKDRSSRPPDGVHKLRWREIVPWSSARESTWLNWVSGLRLRLDVRAPSYMNFKRGAAFVYFQTAFVPGLDRFVFECRFENQDLVDADLDEAIYSAASLSPETYPNASAVRRNTTVIYRHELSESLFENINSVIDEAFRIVEETIDRTYPDHQYATRTVAESQPEMPTADDDVSFVGPG